MSEALVPLPLISLAPGSGSVVYFPGLPPRRLLSAAAARPALVRSIIVSRSSCPDATIIINMAVPMGPVVSRPSVRERKPAPRSRTSGFAASAMSWSMSAESAWAALSASACLKGSASALSACSTPRPGTVHTAIERWLGWVDGDSYSRAARPHHS